MKPIFSPAIWPWTALVLVASFLSWATMRPTSFSGFPGGFPGGGFPGFFGGLPIPITISINGWSGHLTLLGVQLPNWLVIAAALGAVLTVWSRSNGAQLSPRLASALIIYALVHVAFVSVVVLASGQGTLGIGAIIMLAALGGLLREVLRSSTRTDSPASERDPAAEV